MNIIVLIGILEILAWVGFVVLWILTPEHAISDTHEMYWFFIIFNPFIAQDKCNKETPEKIEKCYKNLPIVNAKKMKNFLILCIPQLVLMYLKSHKSILAWMRNFEIKATERFYRLAFTYYTFMAFIDILMFLMISLENKDMVLLYKCLRLLFPISTVFVMLPIINRFIDSEKERLEKKNNKEVIKHARLSYNQKIKETLRDDLLDNNKSGIDRTESHENL